MIKEDTSFQASSTSRNMIALVALIAVNLIIGAIGGIVTASSVTTWYRTLAKPSFNPPDYLFAPVWTILYVVIAIAAWQVWRSRHALRKMALGLYGLQLLLNFIWSIAFFGLRNPGLALVDITALLATALGCLIYFARIDRIAALLWVPYLAWLSFATSLNAAVVALN